MADNLKEIKFDSWCVTKINTVETKYQWKIENFNLSLKKPQFDYLESGSFSSKLSNIRNIEWKLRFSLKPYKENGKDYLSMLLLRLDDLKDLKPIVKVSLTILNSNDEIELTKEITDEADNEKGIEISCFLETNSQILEKNKTFSVVCCLKIGLDSINEYSSGENSIEAHVNDEAASQVIKDLQESYNKKELSDCSLTTQNKKFYVQKAVLSARSSTFFNMFKNGTHKNQDNTQEMEDYIIPIDSNVLDELLHFIYTGKLQNVYRSTKDLFLAADSYDLPGMKKLCAIHLGQKLCCENVIDIFDLSKCCVHLRQLVTDFMKTHKKELVESTVFKQRIDSSSGDLKEEFLRILMQKK